MHWEFDWTLYLSKLYIVRMKLTPFSQIQPHCEQNGLYERIHLNKQWKLYLITYTDIHFSYFAAIAQSQQWKWKLIM